MKRIRVALRAADPVAHHGLTSILAHQPGLQIVPEAEAAIADVLVVSVQQLALADIAGLRTHAAESNARIILVIKEITERDVLIALEFNVASILPLSMVTARRLVHAIRVTTAGGAMMPPGLTGVVLRHLNHLLDVSLTLGMTSSRLTTREIEVIRMIADGVETDEIAVRLNCSPRTVKEVIGTARQRVNLRNRPQVVAYAIRAGAI
jgi:DNA-binding NarL/FixJ family response regulator